MASTYDWVRSASIGMTLAAGAIAPLAARGDGPTSAVAGAAATQPAGGALDDRIDEAIGQLGSGSFETREKAANFLWSLGDRAVPALKEAAAGGGDPEVARRARAVLDNFAIGVRPDTPQAVRALVTQYRSGNEEARLNAVRGLVDAKAGASGPRVLLRLAADEKDPDARRAIVQTLSATSRKTTAALLADGDVDSAGALLRLVAGEGEVAARDLAAFLLVHGGIDDEIRRVAPRADAPAGGPHDPKEGDLPAAVRLAYLCRAKGDLPAARAAAGKSDVATVTEGLAVEAGDWKAVAAAMEARGVAAGSIEDLGYVTAFHRLAGDAAGADQWAAKIGEYAEQNPDDRANAAEALFLNDRPDAALGVLTRAKDYATAVQYLGPRLQFKEVLDQYEKAKADGAADLPLVEARAAGTLHFTGRYADARAAAKSAVDHAEGPAAFGIYLAAIEAGRAAGVDRGVIDRWCADAMEATAAPLGAPQPHDPVKLLDRAGFDKPEPAHLWWQILAQHRPNLAPAARLQLMRSIDRGELPTADVKALAEEAQRPAAPANEQVERAVLAADALADVGDAAGAVEVMERGTEGRPTPALLVRLGDAYAKAERWDDAATAYARAFEAGRPTDRDDNGAADAAPLLLRGWATAKAGRAKEGGAMVEAAHLMPLADDAARHALMELLLKRGLTEDAARERELILRTGEFGSWHRGDALRRAAEDAHERGDYAAAARMWEQAFLNNFSPGISFVEPTANLMIPAMIHRTRAQAAVKAGRIDEAVREAAMCWAICPGDADSQIAVVNDLDAAGRKAEADAAYARARALYAKLATDYPDSGPARNLAAWFEGKCRRDLDEALAHAKRATEIEPGNAAILDTLAEVYFQRGEVGVGLDLVRECRKLEPNSEHHKKNLARFEAAMKDVATTRPAH